MGNVRTERTSRRTPDGGARPAPRALRSARRTVSLIIILMAVALLATVAISHSSSTRDPFSSSWASPLPENLPISPDSASIVRSLTEQYRTYYGAIGINQLPIYKVGPDQVRVSVTVRPGCNDFIPGTGNTIPIPAAAMTSGTGDSPLIVYQPSTNTEWELWQAWRSKAGTWQACWGGRLTNLPRGNGVFPAPYGLSASEISYLGTTITDADILAGRISHTMALDIVNCNAPEVPPAIHTDCGSDPGEPSEGTLFRLPQDVKMPPGLTRFGHLVFEALKSYGMVVTDRAGAVVLQAQGGGNEPSGGDMVRKSWDGRPEYAALDGIPWDKLVVLSPTGRVASR